MTKAYCVISMESYLGPRYFQSFKLIYFGLSAENVTGWNKDLLLPNIARKLPFKPYSLCNIKL
jgi:hypothetical protein